MSQKIVITGANGFIGRTAAQYFLHEGWSVTGLVRQIPRDPIEGVFYRVWQLGQTPPEGVFAGVTALLHTAHAFGKNNAATNVEGSATLLNAAHDQSVKRLVFLSSFAATTAARSEYGKQKALIQQLFAEKEGLVIRPGLVVGKGGLFLNMMNYIRTHKRVPLVSGGRQPVQTVGLKDLLEAVFRGIQENSSGIYTLAERDPISMREFNKAICRTLKVERSFISLPFSLVFAGVSFLHLFGIPTPVTKENLLGLKLMKAEDVSSGSKLLGRLPHPFQKSLKDM